MKVKELIEKLKKFDENLEVLTEGCDCYGNTVDVVNFDGDVLIKRDN